MIKPNILLMI